MSNELAQMMADNLNRVWNERSSDERLKAIETIYATDAHLYHVGDQVSGIAAISASVAATLKLFPADFVFVMLKPVVINNSIGRLLWGIGPDGQAPVATGMDIAHFEDGRIKSLYVFLD